MEYDPNWKPYKCIGCGRELHTWETRGRYAPRCKPCWERDIRPTMSMIARQALVLGRMIDKYGLDRSVEEIAVWYMRQRGYLAAVRVIWRANKLRAISKQEGRK